MINHAYVKSIMWMLLAVFFSCLNDTISKHMAVYMPSSIIIAFRFFFCFLTLMILMIVVQVIMKRNNYVIKKNISAEQINAIHTKLSLHTKRLPWHFLRACLWCSALWCWNDGLRGASIITSTVVGFGGPIFVMIFSIVILHEKVTWRVASFTVLGFVGVIIAMVSRDFYIAKWPYLLILSLAIFALLHIIDKKLLNVGEKSFVMLFYAMMFSALLFCPLLVYHLIQIGASIYTLSLAVCLGIGGNMLLFCTLMAYRGADISSIEPWKYTELIFAIASGYFIFDDLPKIREFIGAIVVIMAVTMIMRQKIEKESNVSA